MKQRINCRRSAIAEAVADGDAICRYLPGNYADAYVLTAEEEWTISAEALQRAIWSEPPGLVGALMRLRNAVVRPLGLKADAPPVEAWLAGGVRKQDASGDELVIDSHDRHLDFQLAVKVSGNRVSAVTVVHYHHWLGRAYFACIRPFHSVVVRSTLRHVLQKGKISPQRGGA